MSIDLFTVLCYTRLSLSTPVTVQYSRYKKEVLWIQLGDEDPLIVQQTLMDLYVVR